MWQTVLNVFGQTSQLVVLLTITGVSFLVLFLWFIGGSVFGADHDVSHDIHHGDASHSGEQGSTVSIFSPRIFFVFTLSFGAVGSIACLMGYKGVIPSIFGFLAGIVIAVIAYLGLSLLHKQQANSLISTDGAIGKIATVIVGIDGGLGEVEVNLAGSIRTYTAYSKGGMKIPRGSSVRVLQNNGGSLIVEAIS